MLQNHLFDVVHDVWKYAKIVMGLVMSTITTMSPYAICEAIVPLIIIWPMTFLVQCMGLSFMLLLLLLSRRVILFKGAFDFT